VIPDLKSISLSAIEGCSELTTIYAPSFSTNTFGNSPDELKHLLVKGGFYHTHLDTILYGDYDFISSDGNSDICHYHSSSSNGTSYSRNLNNISAYRSDGNSDIYYNWGREKDEDSGRLPLCTAAARCLTWVDMQQIFSVNMSAIHEVDGMTGLPVFVLAAAGPRSDIESVYNLLREYPPAILSNKL